MTNSYGRKNFFFFLSTTFFFNKTFALESVRRDDNSPVTRKEFNQLTRSIESLNENYYTRFAELDALIDSRLEKRVAHHLQKFEQEIKDRKDEFARGGEEEFKKIVRTAGIEQIDRFKSEMLQAYKQGVKGFETDWYNRLEQFKLQMNDAFRSGKNQNLISNRMRRSGAAVPVSDEGGETESCSDSEFESVSHEDSEQEDFQIPPLPDDLGGDNNLIEIPGQGNDDAYWQADQEHRWRTIAHFDGDGEPVTVHTSANGNSYATGHE